MNFPVGNFYTSHSGRMPNPTNYLQNFHSHGPCSYCSNSFHSSSNCPSWGQFSNFSHEQMNTNFFSPGYESNSKGNYACGKLMLWEIMLPNLMDCTILYIRSPIIHLPILHHTTILLNNLRWKKLSRNSCN